MDQLIQRNTSITEEKKQHVTEDVSLIKKKQKKSLFLKIFVPLIIVGGLILIILIILMIYKSRKDVRLQLVIDNDEITMHNKQGYSYTLGPNTFFQNMTLIDVKKYINVDYNEKIDLKKCSLSSSIQIPDSYNFRKQFPQCAHKITEQGNLSSSIVAITSAFSDRLCLQNNTSKLTAKNLFCDMHNSRNLQHVLTTDANLLIEQGVVEESCFEQDQNFCGNQDRCKRYFIDDFCQLTTVEVYLDILINGPVPVIITVFRDFLIYKDGIYQILEGTQRYLKGQVIKVIGWDRDDQGYSYWIIENSWGESWGKDGFAHIAQGGYLNLVEASISILLLKN